MEGLGELKIRNGPDDLGIDGTVVMQGSSNELDDFSLDITEGSTDNAHPPRTHASYDEKPSDRTIVTSLQVPDGNMWQAKRMCSINGDRNGLAQERSLTCCFV